MFLGGGFYLMILVYKIWNKFYQACNIAHDSAVNQQAYYSYIKFEQLLEQHFPFHSV